MVPRDDKHAMTIHDQQQWVTPGLAERNNPQNGNDLGTTEGPSGVWPEVMLLRCLPFIPLTRANPVHNSASVLQCRKCK